MKFLGRMAALVAAFFSLVQVADAKTGGTPTVTVSSAPAADEGESYSKFTSAATSQAGLFTVWRKKSDLYFEIAPDQLDTPYLLVPVLTSGLGALAAGTPFSNTDADSIVIRFHRVGDKIITQEDNTLAKARQNSAGQRAASSVYPPSVLSADTITATDTATGRIVFPVEVLLTDIGDLTDAINGPPESRRSLHFHLDKSLSYFGATKAFPRNVDIETDLTFSSSSPAPIDFVPDARSLFFKLHYSIIALPEDDYRPRLADDRMGYFLTARRQYDTYTGPSSFERYIDRWNVQKSDPTARISRAKNPIVFYLSDTIPGQFKPAVRDALLTWNKGFEAIGITHAIEVRDQPNDPSWDPEDARYSVVRWILDPQPAYGAFGAHLSNPYTGEIFRADLVIDGNIMRNVGITYDTSVDPTRGLSGSKLSSCRLHDCDYGYEVAQQAQWGTLALMMDGKFGSSGEPPAWYKYAYLKAIILHEAGHTLGLRHNFAASTIYSMRQVHDKRFTQTHGIVGSVMEYTPLNLSEHGKPQGDYFQTVLGPWDYLSIEYGYLPISASSPQGELPTLSRITEQTGRPDLVYATDEDSEWADAFATDPRDTQFDLSSDPLAYCETVFKIDRRLFNSLPYRLPRPGHSYQDNRSAFQILMSSWNRVASIASHYVGGEYFSRNHRGDPRAHLPFAPVPRSQEKRAFDLLAKYVFSDAAFRFSPHLLNSLGSQRFAHWESDPNALGSLDYPAERFAEAYQMGILYRLWQPTMLARLDTLESRAGHPRDTMSLADLYDWSDAAVWSDLSDASVRSIPPVHRWLQHDYAQLLEHVMLNPDLETPLDAGALARHHLTWLRHQLGQALARGNLDEVTQANLEDIRTSVDRALNANVVVPAQ